MYVSECVPQMLCAAAVDLLAGLVRAQRSQTGMHVVGGRTLS